MLEVLQEEKELGTIAYENGISPNMLRNWRREFLDKASMVFENPKAGEKEAVRLKEEVMGWIDYWHSMGTRKIAASLSYHKGLELLNRVLHRGQDTAIKFRIYRDFCERTGRKIEAPEQTCYISIDDIGVKHQKERRTGDKTKTGVYVWNTVADIETPSGSHTVTGIGMNT